MRAAPGSALVLSRPRPEHNRVCDNRRHEETHALGGFPSTRVTPVQYLKETAPAVRPLEVRGGEMGHAQACAHVQVRGYLTRARTS